jgi:hypothetical protein
LVSDSRRETRTEGVWRDRRLESTAGHVTQKERGHWEDLDVGGWIWLRIQIGGEFL